MTTPEQRAQACIEAMRAMNRAAYAAWDAAIANTALTPANRKAVQLLALESDRLVDEMALDMSSPSLIAEASA